ncbi:MAG: Tat pathway signal sequence domain protein [Saccharothrix sp.]|nr:Tat pathway signal sequence domain protein [Saccharothrix sp.]
MAVTRRSLLAGLAASPLLIGGGVAQAATWRLKWSPQDLTGFESIEDDRADSHPGVKHIYMKGTDYRFDMHTRDRDTSTDRQRNEVAGMRTNGANVNIYQGETWRFTYSMYIPSSLQATTTFTHIMQTKMPGVGSSPVTVMSLRRTNGVQKIEFKVVEGNVLVGNTDLAPLHDKWIDTTVEIGVGDGTSGRVRWIVRSGGTTVLDKTRTGVDTWLGDRLRPKWGIYRSLGDTSGSIKDCHLLLRGLKAYKFE